MDEKDKSVGLDGCEKVSKRLVGAQLTISGEKSAFGQFELFVVGHLCGPYGRKPSPTKVEAISVGRLRRPTGERAEESVGPEA